MSQIPLRSCYVLLMKLAMACLAALLVVSVTANAPAGPVMLNPKLESWGDVSFVGFQFSPDSARVLYRADQETDGVWELYSVPSGGGEAREHNKEKEGPG